MQQSWRRINLCWPQRLVLGFLHLLHWDISMEGPLLSVSAPSPSGLQLAVSLEVSAGLSPRSRLERELSIITDSGIVDFPPELFTFVVDASHDPYNLDTILTHLETRCLGALEGTSWQRILAGLCLVEQAIQRGPPHLLSEASCRPDFNLCRQIWSLQWIEFPRNLRAQGLVRKKATAIWNQSRQQAGQCQSHTSVLGEAFAPLQEWVEAGSTSSASSRSFSFDSASDDGTWTEPRGEESDCDSVKSFLSAGDQAEHTGSASFGVFFTPVGSPAELRGASTP